LNLLSTKDEIEKMLDDIKKNSKPVKPSADKKGKYSDMSVEDLLNSISSPKTKEPEPQKNFIDRIRESSDRYKPEIKEIKEISESVPEITEVTEVTEIKESTEQESKENPESVPELLSRIQKEISETSEDTDNELPRHEPEEIPFRKIFDESPENISEIKKESPEPDEFYEDNEDDDNDNKDSKKISHSVTGVILLIFSVIGIICTINYGIKYLRSFTVGENKRSEFADAVYPAVIMDIEAFQNGNELSPQQVISAAAWKLIMSGEIDRYDRTFDIISVPASDIEATASKLFNTQFISLKHQTVGSGEIKFYYNEESGTYNIPARPMLFSYKPNVTAVSRDGNIYTAEVEYIQEKPSWMEGNAKFDYGVSKTVKFRLQPNGDDYSILSMEIIKVNQND